LSTIEDFGDLVQMGIDLVGRLSELIPGPCEILAIGAQPAADPEIPIGRNSRYGVHLSCGAG
jgi:hypothetical protein